MELKIIASRSPCTALSPYQISWNLPSCSKNISRGHADRQLDRQTHRETGDLISLFSLLASRLKVAKPLAEFKFRSLDKHFYGTKRLWWDSIV